MITIWLLLAWIAAVLVSIALMLSRVVDFERGAIRLYDIDRAKVYSQHLGKKLSKEEHVEGS